MSDVPRGTYQYRERAKQLLCFDGLQFGTITPTDFDLFIDFAGKAYVLGEIKFHDTPVKRGQELALENAADTWERGGACTMVLVASHDVDVGDVLVAECIVNRYRWDGRWVTSNGLWTVRDMVELFYNKHVKAA